MNYIQYLQRLQVKNTENLSYSFLSKLQEQHLFTIPFENLDIHQGKKIVLEEKRIYEKIVVNERGGFCYELNGLFCWLLRSLDFSVSMVSSQVYRSAEERFTPEFDHMVLLVNLEKAYLVDDYAEGKDTGIIDLVLVGDIDSYHLNDLSKKTERYVKRKIRTLTLTQEEYQKFLPEIKKQPHVLILDMHAQNGELNHR
jgi:arylamine N-acetyltransferase